MLLSEVSAQYDISPDTLRYERMLSPEPGHIELRLRNDGRDASHLAGPVSVTIEPVE